MNAGTPRGKQEPSSGHSWEQLSTAERYRTSVGGVAAQGHPIAVLAPYRSRLIASDTILIAITILLGLLVSSRESAWAIDPLLAIYGTPVAIGLLWIGLLLLTGSYDRRSIGLGTEEIQRVFTATLITFAVVAGISYLIRADISRAYAFVSLPLGCLLIVLARYGWRNWLYRRRTAGDFLTRTVVIGPPQTAEALAEVINSAAYVGYRVIDTLDLPSSGTANVNAWLDQVDASLEASGAQSVAIDPGEHGSHDLVRELAWRIEGRGIDLLISAGMIDIAGPRLSMRPIAGLALLHLDEASLSRGQRATKRCLDLLVGTAATVLLAPLMLACAVAVRVDSPGPALFRQARVGRGGRPFTMLKFRSMCVGADEQRQALRDEAQHEQPMFKVDRDPRVTRVGRFLRRWSLDELPQLFNVIAGSMSLVGPRPHPMDDVYRYEREAFRRLALKPGMTGLWQVEGRSDIPWNRALQLDTYYVERWSLTTDLVLLARTVRTVFQGHGAR